MSTSTSASSSLPATQLQWRLSAPITGIDSLQLVRDAPVPRPGRGQVLVRVRACSLNYRDLLVARSQYPLTLAADLIPLSDGAGEVVALGDEVTDFAVGDRVAAIFTPVHQGGVRRQGLEKSLGGDLHGMLAQYRALDASALVRLPTYLSFEEAATLPCATVTAWNALYGGQLPLRNGAVVLVQGTGGVSVAAAQLALAAGARVIATSSSDEKLARMQKLGVAAADCINYKTCPEWAAKVRELTGGEGVDHVVEVGGPNTVTQSIKATRFSGEISGQKNKARGRSTWDKRTQATGTNCALRLARADWPSSLPSPASLCVCACCSVIGMVGGFTGAGVNPLDVLFGGVNLRGVLVGSREMFTDLLKALAQSQTRPVVDRVFPMDQAVEAYKYLESAAHFGKVVIRTD